MKRQPITIKNLQPLAGKNCLKIFDLLCTVSGGGYIGSCLTSLFKGNKKSEAAQPSEKKDQTTKADLHKHFPLSEEEQIHHLRRHGDFLIARQGFFRRDTLRALGNIITGITLSLSTFAAIVFLLGALFVCMTNSMAGANVWTNDVTKLKEKLFDLQGISPILDQGFSKSIPGFLQFTILGAVIGGILAFGMLGFYLCSSRKNKTTGKLGETKEDRTERKWLIGFAVTIVIIHIATMGITVWSKTCPVCKSEHTFLAATLLFLGMAFGAWAYYAATAWRTHRWNRKQRSFANATQSIILLGCLTSLFFSGLLIATAAIKI